MSESGHTVLQQVEALMRNAERLLRDRQAADALPFVTQALGLLEGLEDDEAEKWRAKCLNNRGALFLQLQQPDNALRDLNRAIELAPNDAQAYANRGTVYSNLQQYDKALQDLKKAIDLAPDDERFYVSRGVVYAKMEEYDNALRDLNKAIELRPDYTGAYMNRSAVYSKLGQHENALSDSNKAIELASNDREKARAYANRGNVYRESGRYDEALRDYKKAIELDPGEPDHYHNRAWALAQKAYSTQLAPAEIETTFRKRERAYRKRLGAVEKTIQERRDSLVKLLGWGSGIIAAVVGGALIAYFKEADNGMGFPYILVWASVVLSVLLSGLSYPFINALREAQRDKSQLEIAIEDYFRKGVLMRNVLIGTAEQKPALIAATHEHFANRSTAEFLAETPMPSEPPGMLERMLRAARDQQDDTKTPPPPPSGGTPTPSS